MCRFLIAGKREVEPQGVINDLQILLAKAIQGGSPGINCGPIFWALVLHQGIKQRIDLPLGVGSEGFERLYGNIVDDVFFDDFSLDTKLPTSHKGVPKSGFAAD